MNKTVKVSGLQDILNKLQPLLKQIVNGQVQLANSAKLNVPDSCEISAEATSDPEVSRVHIPAFSVDVNWRALFGILHGSARESLTYMDVGPNSIKAPVGIFKVTAVDDGSGS